MDPVDPETIELQKAIYRSKVQRAREMSFEEKFFLGGRLFDAGMAVMRAGIRSDHPEYSDEQVEAEVDRRLAIARKLDEGDLYRDVGEVDE